MARIPGRQVKVKWNPLKIRLAEGPRRKTSQEGIQHGASPSKNGLKPIPKVNFFAIEQHMGKNRRSGTGRRKTDKK